MPNLKFTGTILKKEEEAQSKKRKDRGRAWPADVDRFIKLKKNGFTVKELVKYLGVTAMTVHNSLKPKLKSGEVIRRGQIYISSNYIDTYKSGNTCVKDIRYKLGVTLVEVAKVAGISSGTVLRLEDGFKIKTMYVKKIKDALEWINEGPLEFTGGRTNREKSKIWFMKRKV